MIRISLVLLFTLILNFNTIVAQELKVEYIAHSSFKLTYNDKSLLIDPFADNIWIGYKFPKNITADAVLISHPHYDHDGGRFIGVRPYWEDQLEIIENTGEYEVGDFKIIGLKGKHCDPYGKEFDQKNIIWLIKVGDMTLVHLGDNGPLTQANYDAIGNPDILFVPIDGDYHILKAGELDTIIKTLSPQVIIPMHYRISDLEEDGSPKDLGGIDPYLIDKSNVSRLQNNSNNFSKNSFKEHQQIVVFKHSKNIKR